MKYYAGVDVGGTNIAVGVIDEKYNILSRCSIKTRGLELPFEAVAANIAAVTEEIVLKAGLKMSQISSVGLGTPSYVNPKTRLLIHANNLGWKNVPLYEELGKHIKKPLFINNDADCAALGEALAGCAGDYKDVLMITLGTGMGGGLIINRRIFNGCDHLGSEMGHTKLVYNGLPCNCGQKGCFESYASATALINQTKEAISRNPSCLMNKMCGWDLAKVDGKLAFDAAKQGDPAAIEVVDQYISYIAAGLSTLISIFRPQVIIIGGGIGSQGKFLLEPLNRRIQEFTFAADLIGVPQAISAKLGNDAGIIGAAAAGITEIL